MRTILFAVVLIAVMGAVVLAVSAVTDSIAFLAVGVFLAAVLGTVLAGRVARDRRA